jgi:hypothetical protein
MGRGNASLFCGECEIIVDIHPGTAPSGSCWLFPTLVFVEAEFISPNQTSNFPTMRHTSNIWLVIVIGEIRIKWSSEDGLREVALSGCKDI